MPQQHTGMTYAGAAGFNATAFQQFQPAPQQQPMMRQFQPATSHHPYPQQQPPQIMQMNPAAAGGMAMMDASQMLQGTTPPTISYMAHHQQIQQPTSAVSQQMQAPKTPSKAVEIVNPNTMKEVDLKAGKQTSSPVSSARSTPKPESEQVQQQFKQNVHGIASTTIDDVATTLPIATVTPLVPGSDVTTTVMADSSMNLASTTLTDEKPKPTITPPVSKSSDVTQSSTSASTSESVHQKEFISEVAVTKDTVSSEIIAKEESEAVPKELTVVSNTSQSSEETQIEQPELPPEANEEPLLPEQHKIEVSGGTSSSSISHEDSKAEETEKVNKPDINMDIKMADDILSEQKGIVYRPDNVEITVLKQQSAAESTKDVADEDGNVLVAPPESSSPELPSSEGKQHASEEVPVTLTRMESGGDEPEERDEDLPPIEEVKDNNGMHLENC